MRDSNTSHCLSVRSMLCFSSWKDIWQGHYSLTSTFMRWLLTIVVDSKRYYADFVNSLVWCKRHPHHVTRLERAVFWALE